LSRGRTLAELALVYGLLLAIVWGAGPPALTSLSGVAIALIVAASWWRSGIGLAALGLAPSRWGRGWRTTLGVSLAGAAALLAAGVALGSAAFARERFDWLGDYALGIVAQQLLLQGFFAPGFARLAAGLAPTRRDAVAIAATALAFAGLHAPNFALVLGVLGPVAFWLVRFRRDRNLPAVLASHLLLGAAAMAALGPGPLLNLRVGVGALELLGR
jgi:hypothetical protein